MKARGLVAAMLMTLLGCAASGPETQVINDAVAALGGGDAINAVNTLVLTGTGTAHNLGQNSKPYAELPRFEVAEYRRATNFSNKQWRQEFVRTPTYLTPDAGPRTEITAVDNGLGFDVAGNGRVTPTVRSR